MEEEAEMERKITIEEKALYKEDYQVKMLKANELDGMLKMGGRGMNEFTCYDYDVSGKISMRALFERSKINAKDIKLFLNNLKTVIREVETFLLNTNCILLKPEYIFYEDGKYFFCYYPLARQDLWEEFHTLTEYFVKQADYQDQECIRMVFLLHKKTMDENYSLEKLAAECVNDSEMDPSMKETEREAKDADCEMREFGFTESEVMGERATGYGFAGAGYMETDLSGRDWVAEKEMAGSVMRESDTLWAPVKRIWNKRKKPKWGEWDGLHIEEEEL